MVKWFMPTWHGDLRVEQVDPNTSLLVLHKPTPAERAAAEKIVAQCKERGWCNADIDLGKRKVSYRIGASMAEVGPIVSRILRPGDAVLTAVVFKDGHVETSSKTEGPTLEQLTEKALAPYRDPAKDPEPEAPAKEPAALATVKRPTPCCPNCEPGSIGPATEALLAFLTPEQHEQWARERIIEIVGGQTGFRYRLAHRHTLVAQRQSRICWDLDNDVLVHFHDWSVPPEEEVLAAKLILEHREPWLRNEATMLGAPCHRFKNPFGDGLDGVESAMLTQQVATFVGGFVGGLRKGLVS